MSLTLVEEHVVPARYRRGFLVKDAVDDGVPEALGVQIPG